MLLGPAGVGKTGLGRALVELGGRSLVVDLTEVCRPVDLVRSFARALGLDLRDGAETGDSVATSLGALELDVVMLDAVDRLDDDASGLVDGWARDGSTGWIVTSRRRLGLRAFSVHHVRPLSLATDEAGSSPAARLFVARVDASPGAKRGRLVPAEIETLVAQLDGLPRAIELFAGLASHWSPGELTEQIRRGTRDIAAPRTDLRRSFEISWGLLDAGAKTALSALALCRGGCTLETFLAILQIDERAALAILDDLVDGSWVAPDDEARDPSRGPRRFELLSTTRDFLESLGNASAGPTRSRLMASFVAHFVEAAARASGPVRMAAAETSSWLRREQRNLESALGAVASSGKLVAIASLASALALAQSRDPASAALVPLLERVVAAPTLDAHDRLRASLALAGIERSLGHGSRALTVIAAALDLAHDAPLFTALLVRHDVFEHANTGDFDGAMASLRRLDRTAGRCPIADAVAEQTTGTLAYAMFDYDRARTALARAQRTFETEDLAVWSAETQARRGLAAAESGSLVEASSHLAEAERRLVELGDLALASSAAAYLAIVSCEQGDDVAALDSLGRARNLAARSGRRLWIAVVDAHYGIVHHDAGRLDDARRSLESALAGGLETNGTLSGLACSRLGAIYAELDDLVASEAWLSDAKPFFRSDAPPSVERAAALYGSALVLARARRSGERASAPGVVEARTLLAAPAAPRFSDERFARRSLERQLAALEPSAGLEGTTLVRPDGTRVDLQAKPVMLRLLRAFSTHGECTKEDLARAVWGMRAYSPSRDDARLQMAITRLRRLLGDNGSEPKVILRSDRGYVMNRDWGTRARLADG